MKRPIRLLAALLSFLLLSHTFPTALANSAIWEWHGSSNAESSVSQEECPVLVERELLTFDLPRVPVRSETYSVGQKGYTASVTAEYHLYNPSDQSVSLRLLFPFGDLPSYYEEWGMEETAESIPYRITAADEELPFTIRHVRVAEDQPLISYADLEPLCDTYWEDGFISPDMPVTCYRYEISVSDPHGDAFPEGGSFGFPIPELETKSLLYTAGSGLAGTAPDGTEVYAAFFSRSDLYNGSVLEIYVLGEPLSAPLTCRCFEDWSWESQSFLNEVPAQSFLSSLPTETLTLLELTKRLLPKEQGISELDWYNAIATKLSEEAAQTETPIVSLDRMPQEYELQRQEADWIWSFLPVGISEDYWSQSLADRLMRCYEYCLTIGAGERLVHTVTAPVYPTVKQDYKTRDYDYRYLYLLSPAKTWKSFGELEIILNTPFYLSSCNSEGFCKTESGYRLVREGLPEGELYFSLSLNSLQELELPEEQQQSGTVSPTEETENEAPAGKPFPWLPLGLAATALLAVLLFIRFRKNKV